MRKSFPTFVQEDSKYTSDLLHQYLCHLNSVHLADSYSRDGNLLTITGSSFLSFTSTADRKVKSSSCFESTRRKLDFVPWDDSGNTYPLYTALLSD